jgi:hypothetical protein
MPRRETRLCRIAGCSREHAANLFCCPNHWWQLPKLLRDDIWRAYRNGKGVLDDQYLQAAENAEAFLEDRAPRMVVGRT